MNLGCSPSVTYFPQDSQSSSSQSQDTSSISLTISQSSHPASSSPNQDPCPSIPSSLAPPLPSLHVPPLPSLNPQARIGGGDSGETDGDRCKSDEEEQLKETTVSRGVRRSGLSRKRKVYYMAMKTHVSFYFVNFSFSKCVFMYLEID